MGPTVVTAAAGDPVDIQALKMHLRLVTSDPQSYTIEDDVLSKMIKAASAAYQNRMKVQLVNATLRWDFKEFKQKLELPRPPLQSVESVKYINSDGNEVVVSDEDYRVIKTVEPGYVLFHNDFEFPETEEGNPYPVSVIYIAGYGADSSKVPPEVNLYLSNLIGTYYMQRESVVVSNNRSVSVERMTLEMARLIQGLHPPRRFG